MTEKENTSSGILSFQKIENTNEMRRELGNVKKYLDATGVILVVIDSDQNVSTITKKCCEILGCAEGDVIGKNWFDTFIPLEKRDIAIVKFKKLLLGEVEIVEEFWDVVSEKSGEERTISWKSTVVIDEAKNILGVLSIGEDVTNKKKLEDLIAECEEKYCKLIEMSKDGLFLAQSGKVIFANQAFYEIFGVKESEILGVSMKSILSGELLGLFSIMSPDERLMVVKNISDAMDGKVESHSYTVPFKKQTGDVVWTEIHTNSVEYKGHIAHMGLVRDVTKAKQAEDSLNKSEHKFKSFVENSNDIIYTLSPDWTISYVSPNTTDILGYEESELIGHSFMSFIHPDDVEKCMDFSMSIIEIGEGKSGLEYRIKHKNGSFRWHRTKAGYLKNVYGDEVEYLAISRDITEQKEGGDKLKETLIEYEHSLDELENLTHMISHDINKPLLMLEGIVKHLSQRYSDDIDSNTKEFIKYAFWRKKHVQKIINDIIVFSRINNRNKPLKLVDCEKIFNKVLNSLEKMIEENNAKIEHNPMPIVMADDTQLTLLFRNLLENAIIYRGQKTLKIFVFIEQKGEDWFFSFKDNGIGIDSNHVDDVFKIFGRIDKKRSGNGVCLAVCKKIVKRHGGRIWVESEPSLGSTFYFTIPFRGESKNE